MRPIWATLLMALFLALAPAALASTTWYVDGVNGNDRNDCKSSTTACKTIGHAISRASSGDSIIAAAATYNENLRIGISLNVTGSSAGVIINGGGRASVVTIPNVGTRVILSTLSIEGGYGLAGAGINNNGTLTISNSTISANNATESCAIEVQCLGGGIFNSDTGTLTISHSNVSDNFAGTQPSGLYGGGGGIYSSFGGLTIDNSTISGNTSGAGGGIQAVAGTMHINKSTISGNSTGPGGGGAGIENEDTATITNSTISGNSAGTGVGGGINQGDTLILSNSTVTDNSASTGEGGGIRNYFGTTTVENSIVANNTSGGNCNGGPIASNGYNLSSDGTCNFSGTGDLNNTDPKLGPLQNNGGPTQTQALLSGSPAIDDGNPSGCTDSNGNLLKTDQRGKLRPDKEDTGGCDMSAYERQSD